MGCKCPMCPECGRFYLKCTCEQKFLPPFTCIRCGGVAADICGALNVDVAEALPMKTLKKMAMQTYKERG